MGDEAALDELFMRAAGGAGGIEPLLASFFSFLHRKTDFYVVHGGDPRQSYAAGFAEGDAERMVLAAFRRWPCKGLEDVKKGLEEKKPKRPPRGPRFTDDGKQMPVGNGGATSSYTWTQTLKDATVIFEVAPETRAKDVRCDVTLSRMAVDAGGASAAGELYERIKDSTWTLERDEQKASLVVTLEKARETWWASIFKGADARECVDTTKVDSTKKMDEYDDETQATIRKIMFDQGQKAKGLPTSDELATSALLDKVKDLPGSPFLSSGA